MVEYYYKDNRGNEYCTTTDSNNITYESGEQFMETIHDAGDQTKCKHRTLSIAPMGATRGSG